MRFLIDANLPPALATWIADQGYEALHTFDLGLAEATDRKIWSYAKEHELIIVTKDEDFILLHTAEPDGPRVVWVRIGNAIRRVLITRFEMLWPTVVKALGAGETVIEVR